MIFRISAIIVSLVIMTGWQQLRSQGKPGSSGFDLVDTKGNIRKPIDYREHYQALANIRTSRGERQVVFGEDSREASLDIDRPLATGWLGTRSPYSGPHCATLSCQLCLISSTTAGSATSLARGNACWPRSNQKL